MYLHSTPSITNVEIFAIVGQHINEDVNSEWFQEMFGIDGA